MERYLANSNTKEIHDLQNLKNGCKISSIDQKHKIYLKDIKEVEDYIKNKGYNGCKLHD